MARRLTRNGLTETEMELYDRMIEQRKISEEAIRLEMELRDRLLICLHGRLDYAVEKIRSLFGQSRYWVQCELRHLRHDGRLLR